MKTAVCLALLLAGSCAASALTLSERGVLCPGSLTLGIPYLDGRDTHLAPLTGSVKTDGKTLTAQFGEPFAGVTLTARILDEQRVEFTYAHLPPDLKIVMTQLTLTREHIAQGVTVSFDNWKTIAIPAQPGADASLFNINATTATVRHGGGGTLTLTVPHKCWFGLQDQRVWNKSTVGLCLTPPLKRDTEGGDTSTFILTLSAEPPPPR